jgi:hypothetical protein
LVLSSEWVTVRWLLKLDVGSVTAT